MSHQAGAPLRLGDWTVDPVAGVAMRGQDVVRFEARTLRLLLYLAARPGQVVSQDELLDAVWPGVTVTPDSVYQAVASLRRQLGDDPREPRYIATAPRLGYRLVAPVGPVEAVLTSGGRRRWGLVLASLAVLAAAGAAVAWSPLQGLIAPQPSVGVMPFLDTSPTMNEVVLTDNLTEDVADALGQIPGLRTPGSRAAFALQDRSLAPPAAARELGVDYLLDGSVRADGPNVQVTVRLIRAKTGFVVWSNVYRTQRTALDGLRRDIAAAVAREVRS